MQRDTAFEAVSSGSFASAVRHTKRDYIVLTTRLYAFLKFLKLLHFPNFPLVENIAVR